VRKEKMMKKERERRKGISGRDAMCMCDALRTRDDREERGSQRAKEQQAERRVTRYAVTGSLAEQQRQRRLCI
jgi:hypothetical protein